MTLRAYVGLLRLEDVLRSHPFYFSAARCAIEVYLHLHDHPLRDEPTKEELQEGKELDLALFYLVEKPRTKKRKKRRDFFYLLHCVAFRRLRGTSDRTLRLDNTIPTSRQTMCCWPSVVQESFLAWQCASHGRLTPVR